jgi:mannan endo-1,4-beta-mannosidase
MTMTLKFFISFFLLTCLNFYSLQGRNPDPADKKATKETIALFRSLYELQKKGIMYGHQDDLMYGNGWWYEEGRSDTRDFTGDYPAVAGFELGHLELGNDRSLDSVSFMEIAQQIKAHYRRGGVVTISWHPNNPFTMNDPSAVSRRQGGTAWDVSSKEVVASILPGGKNHELFNTWLEGLAVFFSGLKEDDGAPIPFIFRPYHEHSGSFFWWGTGICSDKEYTALWRYTVQYLRDKKSIHNILYAYNTDRVTTLQQYMTGYPGDDIIDMLSLDMYDRGEKFGGELDNALGFITPEAAKRNKLTALSETGARRGMTDWWSAVLMPVLNKYAVSYVLTWRHPYKSRFAAGGVSGKPFPDDFINFYNSPRTLFLNEVRKENIYKLRK